MEKKNNDNSPKLTLTASMFLGSFLGYLLAMTIVITVMILMFLFVIFPRINNLVIRIENSCHFRCFSSPPIEI
jgi:uncharacterized membrane protein